MEWIKVEDNQPPDRYEDYFLAGEDEFTGEVITVYGSMYEYPRATHWMPLPPPPEV